MGKVYIDTVKYMVSANVEIDGLVEKPDVVGAVFGQTEGLLGDELDLRELQKNGRIGRIEVDLNPKGGRSVGVVKLPSSLDMIETCVLAAALEAVDRVGPCAARIMVERIEDRRNEKRKVLIERAKNLLRGLLTTEIPESREISEMVRNEVKAAEISEYGPERLPAGPKIEKYDEVILVEGRADVLNLLRNNFQNVVAVGGANVPESIAKLGKEKEVTVFLDGDRGGDIILKELSRIIEIDFIARAPRGKEVEELTRKELIKCLRSKVPVEQVVEPGGATSAGAAGEAERRDRRRMRRDEPQMPMERRREEPQPMTERREERPAEEIPFIEEKPIEVPGELMNSLDEMENTLRARFYDKDLKCMKEMPVRDMIKHIEEETGMYAIVFDGIVTQRLVDLVEAKGVRLLVGIKLGNVFRKPEKVFVKTKG